MTFIPLKTIEEKALALLQQYSQNNGWEIAFPIPIELIIECELEYCNAVEDLGSDKILGAIDQVNKIIYTNENAQPRFDKYKGLYEFTLAHEVGHWNLHCDYSENQLKTNNIPVSLICRDEDKDNKEVQANKYAAALLMPEYLVRETLKGRDLLNWPALYKIAEEWQVSISALKNRLESINLIYFDQAKNKFYSSKEKASGQMSLF